MRVTEWQKKENILCFQENTNSEKSGSVKDIKYLQILWFIGSADLERPKWYFVIKEAFGQQDLLNEYYNRQLELYFEDTSKVNFNCKMGGVIVFDISHRRNFGKPLSVYFNKGSMTNVFRMILV